MNATIVRTRLVLVLALLVFAMFGATSSAIACTKSWAGAVDGNWSDGTKWLPAGSPSSGDDVCIVVDGTYTVTLNVNGATKAFTLGGTTGTQKLDLPGGNLTLTIGADSSIGARGLITMEGANGWSVLALGTHTLTNSGTIRTFSGGPDSRRFINNGTLTSSGTIDLQGGATDAVFGALSLTNTGSISLSASQSVDFSAVTNNGGSIANNGTQFLVKGTYTQGDGSTSGSPIVIGNGGTLDVTGTGSAAMRLGGNISVQGGPLASGQSLDLPGGNLTATLLADFTNAGLITMEGANGYSALALGTHTLTNSGTIRTLPGGSDARRFINNGTLKNSGTIDLQGGATDTVFGALSLTNTGSILLSVSQSVDFSAVTNNAGGSITNNGTPFLVKGIYTQGDGSTSGSPIVIGNGGTLDVTGTGSAAMQFGGSISVKGGLASGQSLDLPGGNQTATLLADFTNAGLITMEGAGGYSALGLGGHTLTNSGTIRTFSGGSDARRFINNGTLTSSGTIDLQGGATDTVFGALSLTNTGSISLSASQSVDLVNVENDSGGSITNNGTQFLVKGTYTQGDGSTSGSPIVIGNGGTLDVTGTGSAAMQLGGNISVAGGPLASGQSLDLPGGNLSATLLADFTNAGLVTMEGANGYSALLLGTHTLTNSGTIRTFSGGSDARRFINNGTLTNTGLLDLQGGATDSVFGAIIVNNENALSIGAGQVLSLSAPFTQAAAGTLRVDHDATPVIGRVSSSNTVTINGCIGGTGPTLTPHTMLTAVTASSVSGTFSCTDFVTQQFNPVYSATQVKLVTPNTNVAVNPSSGSHPAGTPIVATVTRVGSSGFPIGTVHLFEGATLIDTKTLDTMGQASLSTSSLSPGLHTLHVAYDGNGGDDPTDSGHFTITLGFATTTTSTTTTTTISTSSTTHPTTTITSTTTSTTRLTTTTTSTTTSTTHATTSTTTTTRPTTTTSSTSTSTTISTTTTRPPTTTTSTTSTTTTRFATTTTVIPTNRPPDCSTAAAQPATLWPANRQFVDVSVAGVTDPDGESVAVTITGVTQDEPLNGEGDGNTCPDATGVGTATASLRAEREGGGDGRVYHVNFTTDDGRGGRCNGSVAVCVPHDQAGQACVDQGSLVDSTGPTCVGACTGGCAVEMALAQPVCTDETLPPTLAQRLDKAQQLISQAAATTGKKKAKNLMRRGIKVAKQTVGIAAQAAKKGTISSDCAKAVATEFNDAKTGADHWLRTR